MMKRFAAPDAQTGDIHQGDFVLDFDAHTDWLTVEHARQDAARFVRVWCGYWNITAERIAIAFSGNGGFHVTIPSVLFGDPASIDLTTVYKGWATDIKDALGLVTLDAPTRQNAEQWQFRVVDTLGYLPPAIHDQEDFQRTLNRPGIYTRRRMIRREGSRHPKSGLYKIPLTMEELTHAPIDQLRHLAQQRRVRATPPNGRVHLGLQAAVQERLHAQRERYGTGDASSPRPHYQGRRTHIADVPAPAHAVPPPCITRLLQRPPPNGGSNAPLMSLMAYWRAVGCTEAQATTEAVTWLVQGVHDSLKRQERIAAAQSVARQVYERHYQFARCFVRSLRVVTNHECASCPLKPWCWRSESAPQP